MSLLSRVFDKPTRLTAFAGVVGLILLALLTLADVLLRWLFNTPIDGVDDITQLAMAVAISSTLPTGLLHGHNVTIRFLGKGFGPRVSHWLEAFGATLTLIFFVLLTWQFAVLTIDHFRSNNTTMIAEYITWPWWAVAGLFAAFGTAVQTVVLVGEMCRAITGRGAGGTLDDLENQLVMDAPSPMDNVLPTDRRTG